MKFWHAAVGLYAWEFFNTLDYEWDVIRGRLPYRWTIWVYSTTRVSTLVGLTICLAIMDIMTPINCQFWTSSAVILFYLSATNASLLIVLRIIAIWNRNRVVVILAITVLVITVTFHLQNITQLRSAWIPAQLACEDVKIESSLLNYLPTMIANTVLLLIMLVGLLKLRPHDGGTLGLTSLLWKQGLIWLALATIAEIPPILLILLKIDNQLNIMFETPSLITMTIASARMHRTLADFASKSSEVAHEPEGPPMTSLVFLNSKRVDASPTELDRIKVAVHTVFEQHPTGLVSNDDSSSASTTSTRPLSAISPAPILGEQCV